MSFNLKSANLLEDIKTSMEVKIEYRPNYEHYEPPSPTSISPTN
jgi:hypothetical protein